MLVGTTKCFKFALQICTSSVRPHPLKEGVPTALQDANRAAAAVRLYSFPDVRGWSGFGETRSHAQVRRGVVLRANFVHFLIIKTNGFTTYQLRFFRGLWVVLNYVPASQIRQR